MGCRRFLVAAISLMLLAACGAQNASTQPAGLPHVLAVESFLADIAQNVAGDRLLVETLIPLGVDPHAFQPTPQDVARIASTDVLIVSGAGLESFLDPILQNASGNFRTIEASAGLSPRPDPSGQHPQGDPHFWLDPNNVIQYANNIRDGLTQADPTGAAVYAANAQAYVGELQTLDAWIKTQVQTIPAARRLLVTNHESLGYFADRYGFRVVGAIVPSFSSEAAPSAQQLAGLIELIRQTGAPAVFLEAGANPQLADQIASETGAAVVADLYTHSLSTSAGPAPTYLDMIRYDVSRIVEALK
jgi:ABC-type Zn uptake system ZnuABC Zn-binding protein ZnuA